MTAVSLLLPACTTHPPQAAQNKFAEMNERLHGYIASEATYTQENLHKHPYADLLSSAEVNGITWQERKYITDALDEFPKRWVLKDLAMVAGPDWLDDHHVAVSVRSYPGWVAKANDQPRIISINLDTGEIKDSGYRGNLQCLNHKGDLMISLDPEPARGIRLRDGLNWYIGTWGKPLQEIKWLGDYFVPKYLCRYVPYGDLIHGSDLHSLPDDAHRILPLLPEHGVLKESIKFENKKLSYPVEIIKADGTLVRLNMDMPFHKLFNYQPWDKSYFLTEEIDRSSITVRPSGQVIHHIPPKIFRFWKSANMFYGIGLGTFKGILWIVISNTKKWRKNGIYLETEKGLLRIDEGEGSRGAVISPNGCRILIHVERGFTFEVKKTAPMGYMLIDLCNTGAK